ncbi:MAG: alpha-L-arabinofuranosidase C-terminal domain-containing protein, partial [Prevotella sp.]|nr:alpha-L-arabinofuranosidase C-terminal domain-containing protein [Prevotella sp.]
NKIQQASGRILTCKSITDYNDFENPAKIAPTPFKGAKTSKNTVKVTLPAKSIVVLNIK